MTLNPNSSKQKGDYEPIAVDYLILTEQGGLAPQHMTDIQNSLQEKGGEDDS